MRDKWEFRRWGDVANAGQAPPPRVSITGTDRTIWGALRSYGCDRERLSGVIVLIVHLYTAALAARVARPFAGRRLSTGRGLLQIAGRDLRPAGLA